MHDDITLTTERAARVLAERIWPAVHGTSVPLEVAWHALPGEPVPPAEGLALAMEPYEVGTPWGPAWGTTWFRLTGTVPAEWAGRTVEAVVDLGFDASMPGFQAEALVYRPDGTAVKSINPRNQHVPVADAAAGGERVELYLEAASNPVLLGHDAFRQTQEGDIRTSSPRPLYTTRRIDLALFEEEVHALALDVEVLLQLQAELPTGPRRMRVLQALDDALDALDLQRIPETAAAARSRLADVLASPAEHSAHQISAVGHAHIDSAWLWPVRETIRKVARTTSSMTDLIDRTDDFVYGMSSAQQYAWVKEHRPEIWGRIKEAVAAGRFLPLGGMWVESDTVMPSGEALARQFSQGQRFFEREFGLRTHGVWLPDSFGYSPALPQLVRRAGFDWFFTQKISWNQVNVFPHHTFWWEGIDGSRVLTHFPPMDTYNSQLSGEELARATRQFREARHATGSIAPVGWGDGGGGTTREMTGRAQRLANLEGSARVRWEHPDAFFERAREELAAAKHGDSAVWVGELYLELHRATLTSQHKTKQGNRRNEQLLVEAEAWAAAAAARTGEPYPYDELDDLWQQVLLMQFHDILPGTSVAWVHREAVERHAVVTAGAQQIIERSLRALVGEGDVPLRANPAGFAQDGVPALGVAPAQAPAAPASTLAELPDGGYELANDLVRVTLDAAGHVTSAVDLATGRDAVAPGRLANVLQLHQDFPNKWDAWDVDRFYRNAVTDLRDAEKVSAAVEDGVAVVRVHRVFSASTVDQVLTLAPGSRTLEVTMATDWHETEKFLKVAFPLDVRAEQVAAETQFGYHQRVTHTNTSWEAAKFETSMHRWVLAQEPGFGVGLVNDSVYGFDVTRDVSDDGVAPAAGTPEVTTTVRLSLLRAPRFPDPETDQGVQTHRYGLVVGVDVAGATEAGTTFGARPRELRGATGVDPLVRVEGGVTLSAVKLADDRSGDLVVRVYEALGRRASGTVTVATPVAAARVVSLIEDDLDDAALAVTDGSVAVDLGPFEVRTLRFTRA
ncbi:alpha-mannosidase [Promicromonospora citrea]|uniref:Alpha-mannosidase n=1 Tax=Promicromonospora citrea TaxID=43677 RepID=A0A8H9GMB6_9MICO|nr:glycoside hydrolase family 38 C-terminal domain-containing protein [Promicromonospora citrea]NNH53718.1 alpha-mannosidase [Promicromonospora citrea]GGM39501.1 alpha-mannosidase [Promicromonospora citrea]